MLDGMIELEPSQVDVADWLLLTTFAATNETIITRPSYIKLTPEII